MKSLVSFLALSVLWNTTASGFQVINNCNHDIYVATLKGTKTEVNAAWGTAITARGWFRVIRHQRETFDTPGIRIFINGTILTKRGFTDREVSYGCGNPKGQFDISQWYILPRVKIDPQRECLLHKDGGHWLAYQKFQGDRYVVEGLECTPAASLNYVHYRGYIEGNDGKLLPVNVFRDHFKARNPWRLVSPLGDSQLQASVSGNDYEFVVVDSIGIKGAKLRVEENNPERMQIRMPQAPNWTNWTKQGGWVQD